MLVAVNIEQLLYRPPGGIGRYTAKLVTLLPEVAPDVTVVPFTARHSAAEVASAYRSFGLPPEVPLPVRLPLPRPLLYDAWHTLGGPRLGWLSRNGDLGRVDLVHAPSVAVPPKGRARLVVTVHDAAPLIFPETFTPRGRWFHRLGIRAAARRADLIITVSHAAAAEIADRTDIAPGRIRVVPNGVDLGTPTEAEVRAAVKRRGLDGAPYVLWVGSLEPRKNVGTLVRAFTDAADVAGVAGLPHRLALAGPAGWLGDGLVAQRDRDRLGDRLRLLGPVGHEELPALYAGADMFAFPSSHEGFGLPVLEAMAQGTPVVCADIPSLREVAGGVARLVPPNDAGAWTEAIISTVGDRQNREALAAAGRRRAAQLTWERTVRATRDVYDEALARGR